MSTPKSNFAEELAKLTLTPTINNSYYNDEHYVSTKVPDLDKTYAWLCDRKTITKEDLEGTVPNPNKGSHNPDVLNGLDLLKITLHGDFNEQLEKTSSLAGHHQAALATWAAMERGLGKEETLALWAEKEPETWIRSKSLAELVVQAAQEHTCNKDTLRAIHHLTQKIKDLLPKEFSESRDSIASNPAELMEMAKAARRNDVETILANKRYPLKEYAVLYYLTGHCPSKEFNDIAEKIPTSRDVIAATKKLGEIEI
jgi:hypothetical protein